MIIIHVIWNKIPIKRLTEHQNDRTLRWLGEVLDCLLDNEHIIFKKNLCCTQFITC